MAKSSLFRFVLVAVVALLIIPFAVYCWNFDGGLADDPSLWGTFGDYLNPFVSLFNAAAFIYLTHIIHVYERKREHRRTHLPKALEAERLMQRISADVGVINMLFDARKTVDVLRRLKKEFDFHKLQLLKLNQKSIEFENAMRSAQIQEKALSDFKNKVKDTFLPAGQLKELIASVDKLLENRNTLQAIGMEYRHLVVACNKLKYVVEMETFDQHRFETIREPEHLEHLVELDDLVGDQLKILQSYIAE